MKDPVITDRPSNEREYLNRVFKDSIDSVVQISCLSSRVPQTAAEAGPSQPGDPQQLLLPNVHIKEGLRPCSVSAFDAMQGHFSPSLLLLCGFLSMKAVDVT